MITLNGYGKILKKDAQLVADSLGLSLVKGSMSGTYYLE